MSYVCSRQVDGDETVVLTTSKGDVHLRFFPQDAPNHVACFLERVEEGFYDGTVFHRVVADFVVQGGDPFTKTGEGPAGTGGPGYTIAAEFSEREHVAGTLAMARSAHPDSAGSQFYVSLGRHPHLDRSYTVFGEVAEGMDVIRSISQGDVLVSARIEKSQ